MHKNRVVVTGIGILSAVAEGTADFTAALKGGFSAFSVEDNTVMSPLKSFSIKDAIKRTGYFDGRKAGEIIKMTANAGLPVQASVMVAAEAWEMAGLFKKSPDPERISVLVAGNNTTTKYIYDAFSVYQKEPQFIRPSYAMQFMNTYQLGVLSEIFSINGEGFTVGGASASGNIAIIEAYRMIQYGLADICLVMGTLADLSPVEIQGFINSGSLGGKSYKDKPEKACRPFDRAHEGFILGQASGCLILESIKSAVKRGSRPLAAITGVANRLHGTYITEPSEIAEAKVMQIALQQSGRQFADVDYINAHATSTPSGDIAEIAAIKSLFQESVGKIWINSTKSITGHCLWSAGVVEAIATIIQMREGFLHPNLNLDNPIDKECRFTKNEAVIQTVNVALSNNFGFSGINTCLVIEREVER